MPFPDSQYPSVLRGYDKRQSERLLNAAPDLLSACQEMVNAMYRGDAADEMIALRSLRHAIAKAEGQ